MSTHMPVFQSFFQVFLHHFVLVKLATCSIKVKEHRHSCGSRDTVVISSGMHLQLITNPQPEFSPKVDQLQRTNSKSNQIRFVYN